MSLVGAFSQLKQCRIGNGAPLFRYIFTRSILSSTNSSSDKSQLGELQLRSKLNSTFPNAEKVHVEDISGGCGAMYQIEIHDNVFNGLSKIKQHQLVNEALKEEIKGMHGIRISTGVPSRPL